MIERAAAVQGCEFHTTHAPTNLTVEFHHVIPVAWQLHTPVTDPPFPGRDPDGRGMLWDNRGTWICPTSHRNVHHYIVALMLRMKAEDELDQAWATLASHHGSQDAQTAYRALTRYAPYGDLQKLAQAGQLGQS